MSEELKPRDFMRDNERRHARAKAWKKYAGIVRAEVANTKKLGTNSVSAELVVSDDDAEHAEKIKSGSSLIMTVFSEKESGFAKEMKAAYRLIFYWIAFEALFNTKQDFQSNRLKVYEKMNGFLEKMVKYGNKNSLRQKLKEHITDVNQLIKLPVTWQGFWLRTQKQKDKRIKYLKGELGGRPPRSTEHCKEMLKMFLVLEQQKRMGKVEGALGGNEKNFFGGFQEVFMSIFTTRHQIIHGGNSLRGSRGKTQIQCAANLLAAFVPTFVKIMKKNPDVEEGWGELPYPHVGSGADDLAAIPPWLEDESKEAYDELSRWHDELRKEYDPTKRW